MEIERNIILYRWFTAMVFTPVFVPVAVLYWIDNGLDMTSVFVLQALFAVAVVVLEVPTGMVADRLGKRASLLAGSAVAAAGFVLYALGTGFGSFLVAEIAIALAAALISGADSAFLYDTLEALGRETEYTRIAGRARAGQMATFAVCNVIGGFVGAWSLRATVWMSVAGPLAALVVAARMVEAAPPEPARDAWDALRRSRDLLGAAARFVGRHRLVRWYVGFLAVLTGSSGWLLWLYQPYMELGGLPIWAFGLAFAAFNLFSAAASHSADAFERILGSRGALVAMAALTVAPLVLMATLLGPWSFLFILGHQAVRGVARPLLSERILRYTWADKRSTVLSIASLAGRLFFALSAPVVGWLADLIPLTDVLLVQAAALTLVFGGLALARARIPAKFFVVKPEVADKQ